MVQQHPAHQGVEVDPTYMEAASVDGEIASLKAKREAVRKKLEELGQHMEGYNTQLSRLEIAIAALEGRAGDQPRAGRGEGKKRERRSAGTGFKREEVVPLVAEVLREKSPLSQKAIAERVAEKAKQAGRSRSGLHLRIKEALKDESFKAVEKGYQLS